jgi:CPA2 family monovalent cation:H+ antiporter-2
MKETLLTDIFMHAGVFLGLAALIIPILRFLKIPIALGYLLVGIALGPFALGTLTEQYPLLSIISLKDSTHVKILAELGIVLLLFVIGLELTPRRLWQMRDLVFGLGGAQVLLSGLVIGGIALLWGNALPVSVLLGLGLALSSTALVIQWLHEEKLFVTHMGRTSFSILLFQDLSVVPILLLLTIMSTEIDDNLAQYVSFSLLKMVGTAAAIYFVGRLILKPLFIFANRHGGSEVFMALSLLVIITSASIAAFAGLSMALGAFIAGVLLADTQYRHEIASLITPFKSMLLGIFFVSFGMGINLSYLIEKPFWLIASVFGLMAIKAALIFILCKLWKQTTAVAAESAILLAQAGEFGLLVVGSALGVGLMADDVGQFMLIMIGITMMLTPLMAPMARQVGRMVEKRQRTNNISVNYDALEGISNHVVIFGYGRMGQTVANMLCEEGVEILAFDNNVDHVQSGHTNGVPVYFGDASRKYTLSAANLSKAVCVVITIDNLGATHRIIDYIRETDPKLPIVVRAQKEEDLDGFHETKYVHAIHEHLHIGRKISEKILEQCRHEPDDEEHFQDNERPAAAA